MGIASINPTTGETLKTFKALSAEQIEEKLQLAADTFRTYRHTSFAERGRMMMRAAEILESDKNAFAKIMTTEMGKPIKAAISEAEKCAWVCRYYAEHAQQHLADQIVETNAGKSYVQVSAAWSGARRDALELSVLAGVPFRSAGADGRQCWPAQTRFERAAVCARDRRDLYARRISAGCVSNVVDRIGRGGRNSERRPRGRGNVDGQRTGGRSVASIAGKQIKKTVLELGGSDPFIVMPSANLDEAVTTAVKARTINNGQSCIAAKRFIVATEIYEEFERRFVDEMRALRIGDPMEESTDIGPLATPQIVNDLEEQVQRAVAAGARVLTGGKRIRSSRKFLRADRAGRTSISRRRCRARRSLAQSRCCFACQTSTKRFESQTRRRLDWALRHGPTTPNEQTQFIEELEAGSVFINGMVASDPRLPFGGVKHSGYGRELAEFGIREFVNIKTVWIGGKPATDETITRNNDPHNALKSAAQISSIPSRVSFACSTPDSAQRKIMREFTPAKIAASSTLNISTSREQLAHQPIFLALVDYHPPIHFDGDFSSGLHHVFPSVGMRQNLFLHSLATAGRSASRGMGLKTWSNTRNRTRG